MNERKKILLLLNAKENELEIIQQVSSHPIEKIYLCPVEYGALPLVKSLLKRFLQQGLTAEPVDFVKSFNQKSFDYKKDFIDFVHEVGEKELSPGVSLKQYFVYPSESFSLWWFSLIAEKNPCKSPVFTIFSKVLTICHLQKELACDEIWLTSQTSAMAKRLAQLKDKVVCLKKEKPPVPAAAVQILCVEMLRVCIFAGNLFKKFFDVRGLKKTFPQQQDRLRKSDMAVFTMFPFLNEAEAQKGRFVNIPYGGLQSAMEKNHGQELSWFGIYASINSYSWKEAVSLAGKLKEKNAFFLMEEWLTMKDFGRIFKLYAGLAFRFLKKWKAYKKIFVYEDKKTKIRIDFWPIFQHDFVSSFSGKVLMWRLTDFVAFSNIVRHLPASAKVLYFSEMHGWEKALNLACYKGRDITCVGIQHSIVPLLLLNYFGHPEDLKDGDYIRHSPRPDFLGCVGRITQQMFLENAWPKERLFILGGFRFPSLKAKPLIVDRKDKTKNQIVVAFSILTGEIKEMLRLLYDAFNNAEMDVTIFLKSHPCTPVESVAREMKLQLNPKVFQFTSRSLEDIVPQSKAMIVKESSSVFWGIQHELPIIVPLLYNIVDLSPLSKVSTIPVYVKNAEELFLAVQEIIVKRKNVDSKEYQKFFSAYMDIYPDDSQYYHNLTSAIQPQEFISSR